MKGRLVIGFKQTTERVSQWQRACCDGCFIFVAKRKFLCQDTGDAQCQTAKVIKRLLFAVAFFPIPHSIQFNSIQIHSPPEAQFQ